MSESKLQLSKNKKLSAKQIRDLREQVIEFILFLAAFSSVATTVAILFILVEESVLFFKEVSIVEFITGDRKSVV